MLLAEHNLKVKTPSSHIGLEPVTELNPYPYEDFLSPESKRMTVTSTPIWKCSCESYFPLAICRTRTVQDAILGRIYRHEQITSATVSSEEVTRLHAFVFLCKL